MDIRQLAFLAGQPVAAVKHREHFLGMPKRGLAFLLANVMFWQPMWAQADGIVVANPGTSLGQAGNGVPIVNIATPNGSGLSHNQFHDYNVGAQGVILNNVAAQTGQTQLGGIIVGNPNLTNRVAAQAILNEVVSGNPSQLRGYTEVAGQSARVIVANPYGITCNGCGFINAPRVTLTTGKPVLENGRLDRFQVDQGSVVVEGSVLNATNVDQFEIITRSAKINAEIQAKNLTIVAGRNDVNAQTLNATARADDGSAKPQLAIDSSALGGMYAGAIKLVGTEAGVGVKLAGNLAASGGDIQIDANGQLTMAQASAANAINVKAASLDAQGPVYAGSRVDVQTQGNLTNRQTLAARDGISLSAGGQLTNAGIIEAGVNADNSRNAAGDVSINAQSVVNSGKSVIASRNLTVNAAQALNNQGGTLSGQTTRVSASTLDNRNKGRVLSGGALDLNASQALNSQGLINAGGSFKATIGHLNNNASELSGLGDINLQVASLDNVAGLVNAGTSLSITATGAVNNQGGKLTTPGSLSLKAGHVDNSNKGRIASNQALTASVASLDQHSGGQLTSDTSLSLDLNHGALNNQSGLINAPLLVLKNLQQVDNRSGEISSAQAFTFAATSLDNSNGKLLSNQALTLRVQQALSNLKGTIAAASIDAKAGSLNNNGGTLTSRADLLLGVDGQLDNQDAGLINATGKLDIRAANLNNQNGGSLLGSAIAIDFGSALGDLNNAKGLITTKGLLSIRNLRDLNNQKGELSSDLSYALVARTLDNSDGKLFSRERLDLTAASTRNLNGLISGWQHLSLLGGSLDNRNHGTLSSRDGDLLVDLTGDIQNSNTGALVSKGTLNVTAANLDNTDAGALSSEGAQTLVIAGSLNNARGGLIDSGAGLDIRAGSLNNTKATVNAKDDIRFTGTDLDNSEGVLAGDAAVTLNLLGTLTNTKGQLVGAGPLVIERAAQINNQGGKLISQKLLTLLTGGLDNRNGGRIAANDALTLTASGSVQNSNDGLIYSDAADLTLSAASLDNNHGALQSEGALTLNVGGAIDNQGGRVVAKSGVLAVTAASLDSRGGVLSSLKNAFNAQITGVLRNGQGGVIQAQSLTLKALAGLYNDGGRITAQSGDAIIDTGTSGNFDNRNGSLIALERVSVTGNDFYNNGSADSTVGGKRIDFGLRGILNNRKGIIESASTLGVTAGSVDNQTGQLRALGSTGKTAFSIGGVFDNQNGTLESANSDLSLGAGGLLNVGGNVLHVGTGIFDIATGQLGSAGGTFVTRGGLTLAADSWVNSSLIQADRLTVNINSLNQTASGQLLAVSKLTGTGGNWNNDGLIASDGALDLTLWGTYSGAGRVSSLGNLGLGAGQIILGTTSSIGGGGNTTINIGGLLSNAGRLTSAADMNLTAGNVINSGTLGAGKNLTLTTGALRNERGLIFSGADMQLLSPTFTNNYGQVYSLGSLLIARDKNKALADLLDNRSGSIESTGEMTLAAATLNNVMDVLKYSDHEKSGATITELPCALIAAPGCDYRSGGRRNGLWIVDEIDRLKVGEHSEAASINSGAGLTINAGQVNNISSLITASGDIRVTASSITNQGVQEQEIKTTRKFVSWVNETSSAIRMADIFRANNPTPSATYEQDLSNFLRWMGEKFPIVTTVTNGVSLDAIIQAGGNITLDATNKIDNSVVRPYYAYVSGGKPTTETGVGSGYSTQVRINPQLPPDLAQQQVDPVDLPGFSLPTGQNGMFRLSGEGSSDPLSTGPQSWTLTGGKVTAGATSTALTINRVQGLPSSAGKSQPHKYLIETNPVLTDLKQFMSSDYLLQGLGYDPDQSAKRLGDGLFEQKLVQQAVTARTGQRFIDGQTSDEAVFKRLMDNAIASKNELNLSVGVNLTAQQVAALTHDIVWLEEREVNGEKVLVPVLYLANANNRLAANGSLIQGKDVTLIAGENLENSGTLRASQNLDATAKKDLVSSGLVEAGNLLKLTATNDLTNKAGGIIAGRDVTLESKNGDVINERTVTTHTSTGARHEERADFVDNASRIEAANALVINAGRDIDNTGSVLKSGGDMTLSAKRDVLIDSAQQQSAYNDAHHTITSVTQYGSDVKAGGALQVSAQRDISVVASQVEAKGNVDLDAKGDLILSSAANETHASGWSKKFRGEEDHVSQVSTSVTAGGGVSLSSGKDLALIASHVSAGDEAYLVAGANLVLQSAEESDHSLYSKTKKSSSGKKSRLDEVDSITNVGSSVTSGGNTTLVASNDILIKGSNVAAEKGGVQVVAGNDVQIVAVTDSSSARHESSSSKSSWGGLKSSKVKDQVSETQTTAVGSMISGNTVDVVANRDVGITGSALVSTQDLTVQAGRDLTINAAQNTFTRNELHKEKNRDLSGVLTANKLGVDDITGNQHLSISGQSHTGQSSQTTLTGSTLGSSEGNVKLTSGRELSVTASDLISTKNMSLIGSKVTIAAGMESASQSSTDKSNSLAVGRVIGGMIVDTVNTIRSSVEAAKNADDPRLKAVKLAQAAMAFNDLGGMGADAEGAGADYGKKEGTASNGSLIKIGTELANTHSKSTSEYNSQTARQSTINAGKGLLILADGSAAGTAGDIHIIGSSLKAADTVMLAKNNITLESAQNTADWANNSSNNKTAIGASFNLGAQNGFTLDLGASIAKSMGTGSSVTQVNTTLDSGTLSLHSGNDTTLAGAEVRADSIKALVEGNLNITSRQDTETQKNKQGSAGIGGSICIPPFCYGVPVTGSGSVAAGNMHSEYKAVTDQSGFFAGKQGYDITVGKNTTLQGAVIASEATADRNTLSTDRLIVSDIKNVSEISAQSAGFSASYGGSNGSSVGGSVPLSLSDSDHSSTRSAVSEGTIIVRNTEGANDLVGLNRDTANANQKLDKPDAKAMQERIDLIQSAVSLSKDVIGKVANAQQQAAQDRYEAATNAKDRQAALDDYNSWGVGGDKHFMADIAAGLIAAGLGGVGGGTAVGLVANTTAADTYKKIGDYADRQLADATRRKDKTLQTAWAEGGSARVLLHSLAGALQGLSSGTPLNGAISAGASAAIMPALDDVLKNFGISLESRDAFDTLLAAGLGAAAGGGNSIAQMGGATIAGNIEKYNRQFHPTEARLIEKEAPKLAAELGISVAEAEKRMARAFAFYTDAQWQKTIGGDSEFDAATLKHLGDALSPLAGRYDTVASVLENGNKAYTAEETISLIKKYNVTHSSDFKNSDINIGYLGDPDRFNTNSLVDFYNLNLDYRDKDRNSGSLDSALGGVAGAGLSVWSSLRSMASVGNELLSGNVLDAANSFLDPFVEPDSNMVSNWMTTKNGQDFVFGLQNNAFQKALQSGQNFADLATIIIPGPGEAAGFGKVTKTSVLGGKLVEEDVFFRTMSQQHYDTLLETGKLSATGETFISTSKDYSAKFDGILVRFETWPGALDKLSDLGVRDASGAMSKNYPDMPAWASLKDSLPEGWTFSKVYFKTEKGVMNVGLGKGPGLDVFNYYIKSFTEAKK